MRNTACRSWIALDQPDFVFLTGDLGFMALEELQEAVGDRFINMGVAEQNMVSVSAGLAIEGMRPWVYSIASFCFARPFEQIRNDICQHNLPVMFVGNGGGFAYGSMGSTHHALEDYGSLLTLPNMRVFLPAFDSDVESIIKRMVNLGNPAYLRLGRSEVDSALEEKHYCCWRNILPGEKIPIVLAGPIAGEYYNYCHQISEDQRPDLWVVSELPIVEMDELPDALVSRILEDGLFVVEEHCKQGGLGQQLAQLFLANDLHPPRFKAFCATQSYGRYGSQQFHRNQSGLNAASVCAFLET